MKLNISKETGSTLDFIRRTLCLPDNNSAVSWVIPIMQEFIMYEAKGYKIQVQSERGVYQIGFPKGCLVVVPEEMASDGRKVLGTFSENGASTRVCGGSSMGSIPAGEKNYTTPRFI